MRSIIDECLFVLFDLSFCNNLVTTEILMDIHTSFHCNINRMVEQVKVGGQGQTVTRLSPIASLMFTKALVPTEEYCPGVYCEPGPLKTCQTGFEPPGHQGGIIGLDGQLLSCHWSQ